MLWWRVMRFALTVSPFAAFAAAALLAGACGGSSLTPSSSGDAGEDAPPLVDAGATPDASDAMVYPAPHPPLPRVVTFGGPVLRSPKIVPITYDADPFRPQIEQFLSTIGGSEYWKTVTSEYGVGPATTTRPVHLSEPAPTSIDDRDVKAWFASKLDGTHPEFPAPDADTMYFLYYPAGTTYLLGGWTGCKEFGASDNTTTLSDGTKVAYIVQPRCPAWPGLSLWDSITLVSSHELFEEATDPYKTAYVTNDDDHMAWSFTPPFSEIGDMCMAEASLWLKPAGLDYVVQRAWSNKAAAAGKIPCVPARPGAIYFNAAPVEKDEVAIGYATWSSTTKGVKIPVGQTKTIDLALFSEAPMPAPWRVRAYDLATAQGGAPYLELSLDRDRGSNGDTLKLTIKALRAGEGGGSRYLLYSTYGNEANFWIGYVGN